MMSSAPHPLIRVACVAGLALILAACQQDADPNTQTTTEVKSGPETAIAESAAAEPLSEARLPGNVIPKHYRLDLVIVPDQERFSGHVVIEVDVKEALDAIRMHGQDLNVSHAEVVLADGASVAATLRQTSDHGAAVLELDRQIQPQPARIELTYDAPFNTRLEGIYKVVEDDRSYAFSQMEALSGRLAFPGFDEPAYKTPFLTSVTTRADYHAFSNAREVAVEELPDGMKRVQYAETPPLPTYLVAFTVGPVDVVEWEDIPATEVRDHPLQLRGLAAHGKGPQLRYALEHTAGILNTLEEYFGIAYPYDKLDIVAAPDFAAGAMENAGLIIYRESLLLLDDNPPLAQKRAYASVHAHELAHQWFGNLVTMPWWDDIWLNEAFATWMGHKAVDSWNPDYNFDRNMQLRAQGAMETDSLLSTRQIREPVNTDAEVDDAFDGITYSKGGGVLAMFETYLGEEAFREGVRQHMKRFAHGNATVFDFMESLAAAAPDKNVKDAFGSFLFQPGVPFVHVSLDCSGESAQVVLTQERYLPVGSAGDQPRSWEVPVCMSYGVDEQVREQCVVLDQPQQSVELGSAMTCPDWVMPNRNGTGYYRFAMDEAAVQALAGAADEHLNTREKLAFADSLQAAMGNGSLPAAAFLGAVPDLAVALERAVVESPLDVLVKIQDDIVDVRFREAAQAFAASIYGPRLARLSETGGAESEMEAKLLRAKLIEFLALDAEQDEVRAEMAEAGRAYLGFGTDEQIHDDAVEPDLLDVALAVAGEQADAEFYDHMLAHFQASTSSLVRRALLGGIGRVRDPALLSRSFDLILDESLRVNEIPTLLFAVGHFHNREAMWDWYVANLDLLLARLPEGYRNFMPVVGKLFCSEERAQELAGLFEPKLEELPGAARNLAQSLETMRLCASLKDSQQKSAEDFFSGLDLAGMN
jgi:alanyl aminopeptidase